MFATAICRARQAILTHAGLAHPVTAATCLPTDTIVRATDAILALLAGAIAAAGTGVGDVITALNGTRSSSGLAVIERIAGLGTVAEQAVVTARVVGCVDDDKIGRAHV